MASATIYDHPLYYDILFGWDRSVEAAFYARCFERNDIGRDERVLEVACGTGHVARRLAEKGWRLTGLELRPAMLDFLAAAASAEGLAIETHCADMVSFSSDIAFGAAFNPMSSFRLLASDDDAEAHLRRVAGALRPGGIYVLDLDFLADEASPTTTTEEVWEMSRDGVTVSAREEGIRVDDRGAIRELRWGGQPHLRGYTVAAFVERVSAVAGLEIAAWHPEIARGEVSEFRQAPALAPPTSGRSMVVLRRGQSGLGGAR